MPADDRRGIPGQGHLTIAGCDLSELAREHGTPLYLYDEATLRDAVAAYTAALSRHYPGPAGLTYASKAFLCLAMAQWMSGQGLWLDCTGVGEIGIAAVAGVQRSAIVVHGVNKSEADTAAALAHAGTIVVDNLVELEKLSARLGMGQDLPRPELWLRIRPGLAVETHSYTQTGHEDSKFGMDRHQAITAAELCLERGLPLTGLHFHLGSHFHDLAPVGPALGRLLDLMAGLYRKLGWQPSVLSPGGGWGVAYHEEDLPQPSIDAYVQLVGERVASGCHQRGLPLPRLQLEPGRSIVARAGVALYRVGAVKHTAQRHWLLLDGGLADNPRPALYRARYSALPVLGPDRPDTGPAWLGGPYCESSDVLIEGLPLPDMAPGELIAVPVSGAYQLSMASNYNGACRPAVLWLADGQAHLIREREVADDLIRRDRPLPAQAGSWRGAHG
jgi:diaminopimelate decarboxylase